MGIDMTGGGPDWGKTVKIMSDYGCQFPVWGKFGAMSEHRLRISSELVQELRAWQELFEAEFGLGGWHSSQAESEYAHAAPELGSRMRDELGPDYVVELDTWPVKKPELVDWLAAQG